MPKSIVVGEREMIIVLIYLFAWTFHNHRQAIEEMFDINIECDKRNNTYYIADAEGMLGDKLKMWLLE